MTLRDRIILNNSPLSHFARAGKLAVLEKLTQHQSRHVARAVLDEIRNGIGEHPELQSVLDAEWIQEEPVSSLEELRVFADYVRVLGSGPRGIGESSTLAWAEVNGATAIVDERAGTRRGRERGVSVHGSLWLIVEGFRADLLSASDAQALVDDLRDTQAWFPCDGATFFEWAESNGLL